jgi:hypothetical protein
MGILTRPLGIPGVQRSDTETDHTVANPPAERLGMLKAWCTIGEGANMSDLDRLHEIIDALPPQQVHALLTLLVPPQPISAEEFARRLAEARLLQS